MILVTGGCGFIGSTFISNWFLKNTEPLVNLDDLSYAANPVFLKQFEKSDNYHFIKGDIGNKKIVHKIFSDFEPRAIINFAAHTHVDNSIRDPEPFVKTNITGFFNLLEVVREQLKKSNNKRNGEFRFIQISTDEVFGSLGLNDESFTESSPFKPNSPYSASKAAADHLARSYFRTYGFPIITTHCSNNFGPNQYPEKLIPLVITRAVNGMDIPIYGDGQNIRDWIFSYEHCDMLAAILETGKIGEEYNLGGGNEISNLDLVYLICELLDSKLKLGNGRSFKDQVVFVDDRPGHDFRYAINSQKFNEDFSWKTNRSFDQDLRATIDWYLENTDFLKKH